MPDTATTHAARDHARSMHGTRVDAMPTVPPSASEDLPTGVDATDMLWEETVAGGGYTSILLPRGARLRLVDLDGDCCAGLLLHRADRPAERLNVADTVKVQWQTYLTEGHLLLSDMGRTLATIVADTSDRHDALCGTTNLAVNETRYGDGAIDGPTPNGRDLFALALAKHGLERCDVAPNLNLFRGVRVGDDGTLELLPVSPPGSTVVLRCDLDVLVTIVNVPHPIDERSEYTAGRLRLSAWRGNPAGPDDAARLSTPEAARAHDNTDLAAATPTLAGAL
jgi:urea carboxylase-associated protein 2